MIEQIEAKREMLNRMVGAEHYESYYYNERIISLSREMDELIAQYYGTEGYSEGRIQTPTNLSKR